MQYIALDRQKSEKIAPKSTLRTHYVDVVHCAHETSGGPNNAIKLRLYRPIRRQTTRMRNMNMDISRSLLQSKNSSRPYTTVDLQRRPLAYVSPSGDYSFYCANDLLRRNLIGKHNSTLCCCLMFTLLTRLLVIKDGNAAAPQ